ncbi:Haemolymph juvenile hormone binding [Cinara cedri]|uniref:Haemolymph juvenile hormone binding n=1 Tax=Cinara cedri TaxID=506608 RepID=A0A5E4M4E5_9HEMI|nr:Haemolymph juvenile hormone binding [Cinara cedri]
MIAAEVLKIAGCLVCVIAGIASAAPAAVKLPKGFVQCKKNDPELAECMKSSLHSAIPHLIKGIPSLGMYSIDPLRISTLLIDQGNGPVSIKLNFRDLDILNIGTVKIQNLYADLNNYNITVDVDFDKPIILDGNYDIKGKVIILPITGDGKSRITLENLKAKINVYLKPTMKNGVTYVDVVDLKLKFTTTRMRLKLDNLFKGDKALGNNMNTFLNDNWSEILGELQSSFENALAAAFTSVTQQFFSKVPYNQVFV